MARWVDAWFVRGGTSRGLCFRAADLPAEPAERDALLCAAMGSPDPFGRQLDGMGSGSSSTSKALIVDRSSRPGVDLDYTFAQVSISAATVDYSGNCGNMSAAVVPFALAAGLVTAEDGPHEFTLFNTNTAGQVVVRLVVEGGQAAVVGGATIPGVAGTASPIELVYPQPGGSRTSGLQPTGSPVDVLTLNGREVRASLIDAAIPLVIVAAESIGVTAAELPAELDADRSTMVLLDALRREGAVRMGLCESGDSAPLVVPKVVVVGAPIESRLIDGTVLPAGSADVLARTISMEQTHNAVPGTGAMCLAAAAQVPGTILAQMLAGVGDATRTVASTHLRIGTPSGVVTASARVEVRPHTVGRVGEVGGAAELEPDRAAGQEANRDAGSESGGVAGSETVSYFATEAALTRTARVLMRGQVAVG